MTIEYTQTVEWGRETWTATGNDVVIQITKRNRGYGVHIVSERKDIHNAAKSSCATFEDAMAFVDEIIGNADIFATEYVRGGRSASEYEEGSMAQRIAAGEDVSKDAPSNPRKIYIDETLSDYEDGE